MSLVPNSTNEASFIEFVHNEWLKLSRLPQSFIPAELQTTSEAIEVEWSRLATTHKRTRGSKTWWTQELTDLQAMVRAGEAHHKMLKKAIQHARRSHFDGIITYLATAK